MAPRSLPAERESLLGIDAIEALLSQVPALTPQEYEEAPIAKPNPRLRQLPEPLPQGSLRIAVALIPQARAMEARGHRRTALTDLVPAHQIRHDLTLLDGL
jgi:hypothetical protein